MSNIIKRMSNIIKRLWREIKNDGESIGLCFFIMGILVLLTGFVLAIVGRRTEIWLLSVSLGLLSIWLGFTAIGMSAKTDKYVQMMLESLHGIINEAISAELDLGRIITKKELTRTDKEYLIYDSGEKQTPFLFGSALVCLDKMKEKDVVRIRLYITEDGKELQVSVDEENTYSGIQSLMAKISGGFYNNEGVKITAEQITVHSAPIKIGCYTYDAMRGG